VKAKKMFASHDMHSLEHPTSQTAALLSVRAIEFDSELFM